MINTRMTYLRPGNLFKDFIVEDTAQDVNARGRAVVRHTGDGTRILKGCLAEALIEQRESRSTADHTVTHTIVQAGPPEAKRGDKLINNSRVFYIVALDDAGALGISTIYYAEERSDIK